MDGVRIPDEAFVAHSKGVITDEDLKSLEKFASALTKIAAPGTSATARGMSDFMLQGAGVAAGALGVSIAGHALGTGLAELKDRLTYRRDLRRILDVHPDIAQDYGDKDIHLVYSSMRAMNPDFAKDPLIGGVLLGQILRNRDPLSPSAPPRFDPGTAKDLYTAEKKYRNPYPELVAGAGAMGLKETLAQMKEAREARAKAEARARRHSSPSTP